MITQESRPQSPRTINAPTDARPSRLDLLLVCTIAVMQTHKLCGRYLVAALEPIYDIRYLIGSKHMPTSVQVEWSQPNGNRYRSSRLLIATHHHSLPFLLLYICYWFTIGNVMQCDFVVAYFINAMQIVKLSVNAA